MNKTSMQMLIDWVDEIGNSIFALSAPENELKMLKQFKTKAIELRDTVEREQIIKARLNGFESTFIMDIKDRSLVLKGSNQDYYTQAYQSK